MQLCAANSWSRQLKPLGLYSSDWIVAQVQALTHWRLVGYGGGGGGGAGNSKKALPGLRGKKGSESRWQLRGLWISPGRRRGDRGVSESKMGRGRKNLCASFVTRALSRWWRRRALALRDRYRQKLKRQNLHSWPRLGYWHQQLKAPTKTQPSTSHPSTREGRPTARYTVNTQ